MQLQLQNTSSKEISFYEGHQHHLGSPFKAMQKYVCNDLKEGTDITKLGSFNWAEIIKKMKTLLLMYTTYTNGTFLFFQSVV